jgi:hypothetical protein
MDGFLVAALSRWYRVAGSARRLRLLVLAVPACLLLASAAAAADPGEFSATISPTDVRPSTPASYTITLANSGSASEKEATRATIEIAPEFVVTSGVTATASKTGSCSGGPWNATVVAGTIELQAPTGNPSVTGVCPGGTLAVVFSANNSASTDGLHIWPTRLFRDAAEFVLTGGQPTVQVDGTPPTVSISNPKPSNPSNMRSATFTFTASAPTQCKLDAGVFAPCASPSNYTNLSDGPHTFTVRAADAAGNTAQESYTWTVETGSPTAAVSSGPPPLTNSRSATFAFSADEPSRFECRLDDGSFLPCSSPASYQGLGDGGHIFSVRPIDAVGNIGAATSRSWRIDATAPETTLGARPRSRTKALSASFTFSASEQATFQCKLDASAFAACSSPKTYARIRRSVHTFQVRALDAAGNVDPTPAVLRWTIAAVARRTKASSPLLAPRAGARVTGAPLLVWRPVARASYYNVQLFRGKTKVLSAWPTRARFRLRARWTYLGRQQRLAPGTYRWFIWPRLGRGAKGRYGALLGQSTFTVTAARR